MNSNLGLSRSVKFLVRSSQHSSMHPVQPTDDTKATLIEAVAPPITETATERPEINTYGSREIAHILDSRSVGFPQQIKRSRNEQNSSSSASCQDCQTLLKKQSSRYTEFQLQKNYLRNSLMRLPKPHLPWRCCCGPCECLQHS